MELESKILGWVLLVASVVYGRWNYRTRLKEKTPMNWSTNFDGYVSTVGMFLCGLLFASGAVNLAHWFN